MFMNFWGNIQVFMPPKLINNSSSIFPGFDENRKNGTGVGRG